MMLEVTFRWISVKNTNVSIRMERHEAARSSHFNSPF